MAKLFLRIIFATLIHADQADAQSVSEAMSFVSKGCAEEDGSPAERDTLSKNFGSDLADMAPFCMVYLDAWKRGYDLGIGDGKREEFNSFYQSMLDRAAQGQIVSLEQELATRYSTAEKAVVLNHCAVYQEGQLAGLRRAREMMRP